MIGGARIGVLRAILAGVLFVLPLVPLPAQSEECRNWQELKPYLANFYQIEGEHLEKFVASFNIQPPHSDYHPELVGYVSTSGWDLVRLFMVAGDCLIVDRIYPRKTVWHMMQAPLVTQADFDKSGARYQEIVDRRLAEEEEAWLRQQKRGKTRDDEVEEEQPLAGGVGEMD